MRTAEALRMWLEKKSRVWTAGVAKHATYLATGWLKVWGDRELSEVDAQLVERLEAMRDDGTRSTSALNNERTQLRAFFKWAKILGYATSDPTTTWPHRKVVVKREYVVLSREEEDRLVAVAPPWLAKFVRIAVCTGLREGTIRQLTWAMVREDGVLEIPGRLMKARAAHQIPLPARALEALGPRAVGLVCPLPVASRVWKVFHKTVLKAGLNPAASPHDLRRTFVARLSAAKVPLQVVQRLGGWKTVSTLLNHYCMPLPTEEARRVLEAV